MHAILTREPPSEILAELTKKGVVVAGNPDVLQLTYTDLSVDDARTISSYASLKALAGDKYLIISFDRAGGEAQNALLKVVEEAPGNSNFYFCTPNTGGIIPTLRSRVLIRNLTDVGRVPQSDEAQEFLKLSYADRLSKVEKLITAAQRADDRTPLREFARALVHMHPSRVTLDAVRYLDQNGSSPKLVLSHLAVTLPRV